MRRNTNKTHAYASWMNYTCANPDCECGEEIEVHHIVPIKDDGADQYWNFVSLCRDCHRHNKYHSTDDSHLELYTWKCMQELEIWGFVLDEYDLEYYNNLKTIIKAVSRHRKN